MATTDKDKKDSLPLGEQAWASESVWKGKWEKYNPDQLIGRKGHGIYKKMMLDEQVKAVVHFKRDAITSREWFFEYDEVSDEALSDEDKDMRMLLCNKIISNMRGSFTDKLNGIMTSQWNGLSMTEKKYGQLEFNGKTYWGIEDLKLRPFDTFIFYTDEFDNIKKIVQEIAATEHLIDIKKFIHMVHQPDMDVHYGQSELREAYRAWFSKDAAITNYNIYLERSASGFRVIRPVEGKILKPNTQEYRDLQNVVDNTTGGDGIIFPSKIEMDVHFPNQSTAYPEAIEMFDLHISRALLVPNLLGVTPQGQTGSYSQSETHLEAFMWTLDRDASRLEEVLNEHMFRELGELNFGDDYWPRFKFKPLSDKQIMSVVTTWKELVTAGAVKPSESDEEHIRNILEFPPRSEEDELLHDEPDPNDPSQDPSNIPNQPADGGNDNPNLADDKTKGQQQEETLAGKLIKIYHNEDSEYKEFARSRAEKRVAHRVLGNTTDAIEQEYAYKLGMHLFESTERALENADFEKASFSYTSGDKTKMNRIVTAALKESWDLGIKHAGMEIDKARGIEFTVKQNFSAVQKDFVNIRALKATGRLSDDAKSIVENAMLTGIKAGESNDEIRLRIYSAFANKGILPENIEEELGKALVSKDLLSKQRINPQHRIDTMIRTNVYEAMNEARFNYFNDPELEGFVEALEYSAILDGRTTELCRHLDGKVMAADNPKWNEFRPPNHHNCRSLLIPITAIDDPWKESRISKKWRPPEGFGGPIGSELNKTVSLARSMEFRDRLNEGTDWIKNNDFNLEIEHGYGFSSDGVNVYDDLGNEYGIYIPDSKLRQMRGGDFIHNHPNGSSFSDADILTTKKWNLRSITAVSSKDSTTFVASNIKIDLTNELNKFLMEDIDDFLYTELEKLEKEYLKNPRSYLTVDFIDDDFDTVVSDIMWQAAKEEGLMDYDVLDKGNYYKSSYQKFKAVGLDKNKLVKETRKLLQGIR